MERFEQLLAMVRTKASAPGDLFGQLDFDATLNGLLSRFGLGFPGDLNPITLSAPTEWPLLAGLPQLPWFVWVIAVTIVGILTSKSLRVGFLVGLLSLASFLLLGIEATTQTLVLALMALPVGLIVGLLLGYLHAAHRWIRLITWPLLWLLLTLPILGVLAISTGLVTPNGFWIEAGLLVAAPLGVTARGSALILKEIDPEQRRQAERLGAGHAQQVRLLSLPMSAHSLRSVLHSAVMVLFAVMLALGAVGLPGIAREIWQAVAQQNLGALLVSAIAFWCLAVAVDLIFRFMGRGRLRKLEEAL